jgi:hypothetical protein
MKGLVLSTAVLFLGIGLALGQSIGYERGKRASDALLIGEGVPALGVDLAGDASVIRTTKDHRVLAKCLTDAEIEKFHAEAQKPPPGLEGIVLMSSGYLLAKCEPDK